MKNIKNEGIRFKEKYSIPSCFVINKLDSAITDAIKKVDYMIETLGENFAEHYSVNNVYTSVENVKGWNTGFWTGILWIAYEFTGNDKYKNLALKLQIIKNMRI